MLQLREIYEHIKDPDETHTSACEQVAYVLGGELKPRRWWTGKYIMQMLKGQLPVSGFVRTAMGRYVKREMQKYRVEWPKRYRLDVTENPDWHERFKQMSIEQRHEALAQYWEGTRDIIEGR